MDGWLHLLLVPIHNIGIDTQHIYTYDVNKKILFCNTHSRHIVEKKYI